MNKLVCPQCGSVVCPAHLGRSVEKLTNAIHCMGEQVLPVGSYDDDVAICEAVVERVVKLEAVAKGADKVFKEIVNVIYMRRFDSVEELKDELLVIIDDIIQPLDLLEKHEIRS